MLTGVLAGGRAAGCANLTWGAVLLLRGDAVWAALAGRRIAATERRVLTVLGLRHLGQGAVQVVAPARRRGLWVLTDLAHVASMVGLAVVDPPRRVPALASALVSTTTAGQALAARRDRRPAPARVTLTSCAWTRPLDLP